MSNKLLVTGDHRSITIWKSNNLNDKRIIYEDFHEIIINRDTCQLLEVNSSIFVATQYSGGYFQVYKNNGDSFPLIGELTKVGEHGCTCNCLSKINDKIVCYATNKIIIIISLEPIQIIQKIKVNWEDLNMAINYIYITKNNYLYFKGDFANIIQYKIINDENDNNFVELIEIGKYNINYKEYSYEKAIIPFDDGRIFFMDERKGQKRYKLIA